MKLRTTSRPLALSIVIVGLLSFFWPLVTIDPPVAGLKHWSCLQIVERMYAGDLPDPICETCSDPRIRALLALPLAVDAGYCLMLVAAPVLCMRRPARAMTLIGLFGGYICLRMGWSVDARLEFHRTFFGLSHGQVHYSGLVVIQLVVMGLLFLVGLDLRDDEHEEQLSSWRQKADRWVAAAQGSPKIIDAEIVEEGKPADSGSRGHPQRDD